MNQGLNPKKFDSFIQTGFRKSFQKSCHRDFAIYSLNFLLDKTIQ